MTDKHNIRSARQHAHCDTPRDGRRTDSATVDCASLVARYATNAPCVRACKSHALCLRLRALLTRVPLSRTHSASAHAASAPNTRLISLSMLVLIAKPWPLCMAMAMAGEQVWACCNKLTCHSHCV